MAAAYRMTERSASDEGIQPRQALGVGVTVFLTGLSGAGKSTIARRLCLLLAEHCRQPVTGLDSDVVRAVLSSELGFSRNDRCLNVRRIGFVAAEVTRHGGIAVCAAIAPYHESRCEIRRMIESVGAFVLVHVATSLDICEMRDAKGLYRCARAGTIERFTGVSDPYESPADAELVIDAGRCGVDHAARTIIAYLEQSNLIRRSPATPIHQPFSQLEAQETL